MTTSTFERLPLRHGLEAVLILRDPLPVEDFAPPFRGCDCEGCTYARQQRALTEETA